MRDREVLVSEEIVDLRLSIERLEAGLAAVSSEAHRLRAESAQTLTTRRVTAAVLGMLAVLGVVLWILPGETAAPTPKRVKAPFRVVASNRQPIFEVFEEPAGRGFSVFGGEKQPQPVLNGVATESYGRVFFGVNSLDGSSNVRVGVLARTPAIAVRHGGATTTRAALTVEAASATPSLNLVNSGGATIVNVAEGAQGGKLELGDAKGQTVVEAGITTIGVGKVEVFPGFNTAGAVYPTIIQGLEKKK